MYTFNFQCQTCGEQFPLKIKHMLKSDCLICPNCSGSLPKNSLYHLKTIAIALEGYVKSETESGDAFEHFKFTIQ